MDKVFLWKVDGVVLYHTDLQAAIDLYNLTRKPDKTVTLEEWGAAGGIVRIIDGVIVLGKTDTEIVMETKQTQIAEIDSQLNALDNRYLTPRVLANIGIGDGFAIKQHSKHEELAAPLREQRESLRAELAVLQLS